MKWLLLIEVVLTIVCFVLAWHADHGGTRDEALGAIIPAIGGVIMLIVTVVTLIGWAVYAVTR